MMVGYMSMRVSSSDVMSDSLTDGRSTAMALLYVIAVVRAFRWVRYILDDNDKFLLLLLLSPTDTKARSSTDFLHYDFY